MIPLKPDPKGARLAVRLTPKSSRDRVSGLHEASDGTISLKAFVRAVPEKGRANKALIKLIAKETGLAPSLMSVISGPHARNKVILIKGEPGELEALLQPWLQGLK